MGEGQDRQPTQMAVQVLADAQGIQRWHFLASIAAPLPPPALNVKGQTASGRVKLCRHHRNHQRKPSHWAVRASSDGKRGLRCSVEGGGKNRNRVPTGLIATGPSAPHRVAAEVLC
jgi:hypothetical protein